MSRRIYELLLLLLLADIHMRRSSAHLSFHGCCMLDVLGVLCLVLQYLLLTEFIEEVHHLHDVILNILNEMTIIPIRLNSRDSLSGRHQQKSTRDLGTRANTQTHETPAHTDRLTMQQRKGETTMVKKCRDQNPRDQQSRSFVERSISASASGINSRSSSTKSILPSAAISDLYYISETAAATDPYPTA